jgi:hypothetical protein
MGEHAWGSRLSADAVLRMDFGAPHLRIREPSSRLDVHEVFRRRLAIPTGRWHLFVESGAWRVKIKDEEGTREDAESQDATRRERVTRCLSRLDGQIVRAIARETDAWRFIFDLGGTLTIADAAEQGGTEADWTLFGEDGTVMSWRRDHKFAFEHAEERT